MIRLFLGRDERGKRIYKSTTIRGSREEAETELDAWIRLKEGGILAVPAGQASRGEDLRSRRLRLGVTEDELSEILEVPRARISELERTGGQLPRWLALSSELAETAYWTFNGQKLREREDETQIGERYLRERWEGKG